MKSPRNSRYTFFGYFIMKCFLSLLSALLFFSGCQIPKPPTNVIHAKEFRTFYLNVHERVITTCIINMLDELNKKEYHFSKINVGKSELKSTLPVNEDALFEVVLSHLNLLFDGGGTGEEIVFIVNIDQNNITEEELNNFNPSPPKQQIPDPGRSILISYTTNNFRYLDYPEVDHMSKNFITSIELYFYDEMAKELIISLKSYCGYLSIADIVYYRGPK